jgi:hypothetical protein
MPTTTRMGFVDKYLCERLRYVANVRFNRANKTGIIMLRNVNGGTFDLRGFTYPALTELSRR